MLESKRLILRKVELKDAEDMFEYAKDEMVGPMAGWESHKTIKDSEDIIKMWLEPNSEEENFSIILKDKNKMIGTVGNMLSVRKVEKIQNINLKEFYQKHNKIYEIGIVIGREYWGQGIATEALKLTMEYVFVQKGADAVLGLHYSENLASKKMQEKCNLKEICRKEVKDKWYNTDCTTMVFRGITRNEWGNL